MHSLVFSELLFMIWDWNNKVCLWFSCALEVALPSFCHQMLFFASKLWIFFAKNRSKALNFSDFRCPSLVKKYPFTGKNVFYSYDFWTKGPKCRTHKTDLKNDTKKRTLRKFSTGDQESHIPKQEINSCFQKSLQTHIAHKAYQSVLSHLPKYHFCGVNVIRPQSKLITVCYKPRMLCILTVGRYYRCVIICKG